MRKQLLFFLFLSPLLFGMEKKSEAFIEFRDPIDTCDVLPAARHCFENKYMRKAGYLLGFDFLYFQAKERGLTYALQNTAGRGDISGKLIDPDFKGEFATKAHLGFKLPYDYWDLNISWTNFSTDHTSSVSEAIIPGITNPYQGMGLLPLWIHPAAFGGFLRDIRFSQANATWDMSFNSIDLDMGRDFCISRAISARFFFGLKNTYIFQRFNVEYFDGKQVLSTDPNILTPVSAVIRNRNDSIGIGPRIGIFTKWNFAGNFGLFTNVTASLLFSHFDTGRDEIDTGFESQNGFFQDRVRLREGFWAMRPASEFAMGLDWGGCLCLAHGRALYLNIRAAYEGMYYFKQNRLRRFVDDIAQGLNFDSRGDLFLHGLATRISFSF